MNSRLAIEPANPSLPERNQLIANVSSVPSIRQLIALRIDRACVSCPRNKIIGVCFPLLRGPPVAPDRRTYAEIVAEVLKSIRETTPCSDCRLSLMQVSPRLESGISGALYGGQYQA
jgi:hypothetical protein